MVLPDGSRVLSGFDALRFYDSNNDGKIDVNDGIYSSLMVMTGTGQIASLADAGIKSITLPPSSSGGTTDGNELPSQWASFTLGEREQYLIDQARAADAALRENDGNMGCNKYVRVG